MQLGVTVETLTEEASNAGDGDGEVICEAPCNLAHFLLMMLHVVCFRMTSPRRSSGGEPRPSRALDAQSTSSKCWETWEGGVVREELMKSLQALGNVQQENSHV